MRKPIRLHTDNKAGTAPQFF
ncbi:MAG: hypothetical protein JWQ21_3910, partial [Herminiimonas sp.]|nr:hypothetical protein [Herminiimonas sp.]